MRFGCNAIEADGWYGVTLFASVNDSNVFCYKSVFRGNQGRNPKEVVALYTDIHQNVMKQVNFSDDIPEGKLEQLITKSVELAASGMQQWGLKPVEFSTVPNWVLFFLFANSSEETIH